MKGLHMVAFILLIVGGLNWLLVGLFGVDVGALAFGDMSAAGAKVVYVLVGLSAIFEVATHKKNCRACDSGSSMSSMSQ